MGLGIASFAFALACAIGAEATNYISVYVLGMVDSKFGDEHANLAIGHQVLPLLVVLTTASFVAGVAHHRMWLGQQMRAAALAGGLVGFGSSAAFLGVVVLGETVLASVAELLIPVNLFILGALPAVTGHFVCVRLGARSGPRRSAV